MAAIRFEGTKTEGKSAKAKKQHPAKTSAGNKAEKGKPEVGNGKTANGAVGEKQAQTKVSSRRQSPGEVAWEIGILISWMHAWFRPEHLSTHLVDPDDTDMPDVSASSAC